MVSISLHIRLCDIIINRYVCNLIGLDIVKASRPAMHRPKNYEWIEFSFILLVTCLFIFNWFILPIFYF